MYRVLFYEDEKGRSKVDDFLDKISIKERAKVEKWIEKLEEEGPNLPRPYSDVLRGKIRELRVRFGSNSYRFLYFFFKKDIIITHGFRKKTDVVSIKDMDYAERIMGNFLIRIKQGDIVL